MKILSKIYKQVLPAAFSVLALGTVTSASAATVGVDPATHTSAFMGWGGPAGNGGSVWGFADSGASHSPGVLTLTATPINDPDPYWYPLGGGPGAVGDKIMTASNFSEVADGTFGLGETVTFSFEVLSNTLVSGYSVQAFISDFTSDFGYNETTSYDITSTGFHSFDHVISSDPGVNGVSQWGFRVVGPNVWGTDVAAQGNIQIAHVNAVPVPAAAWLFGSALIGLVGIKRKK